MARVGIDVRRQLVIGAGPLLVPAPRHVPGDGEALRVWQAAGRRMAVGVPRLLLVAWAWVSKGLQGGGVQGRRGLLGALYSGY